MAKFKKETSAKLIECQMKVADFQTKLNHYYDDTVKFRMEITEAFEKHSNEILERLHIDESRLQDLEIKHLNFTDLKKKFLDFEKTMLPALNFANKNAKTPLFVERYLPLLIHL